MNNPPALGDRIIGAFVMLIAAGFTSVLLWLVLNLRTVRYSDGNEILTPFFILIFTGIFLLLGFIAPIKSTDALGWVWKRIFKT